MISSLRSAASGLYANQQAIDTIAGNLANVNTNGYKRQRANFSETIEQVRENSGSPGEVQFRAAGTGLRDIQRFDAVGNMVMSPNPLDVAITGAGYFPVTLADGTAGYSRDGSFRVDGDGQLVNSTGQRLAPTISVPDGASDVAIAPSGNVTASVNGATQTIGTIQLATFPNPAGLELIGNGGYRATESSGAATLGAPAGTAGELLPGAIEQSNVDVADEMTSMLLARRAYGLNLKALQTTDDMLQGANGLGV